MINEQIEKINEWLLGDDEINEFKIRKDKFEKHGEYLMNGKKDLWRYELEILVDAKGKKYGYKHNDKDALTYDEQKEITALIMLNNPESYEDNFFETKLLARYMESNDEPERKSLLDSMINEAIDYFYDYIETTMKIISEEIEENHAENNKMQSTASIEELDSI